MLWGMGATNRAVAAALARREMEFIAVDDSPDLAVSRATEAADVELQDPPEGQELADIMSRCAAFLPTPGMADRHPAMRAAAVAGARVISEFDLAAVWDERPVVAITGTNGKTTVTTLVAAALAPSSAALAAGNNELPLVSAIEDSTPAMFVAEASSFRLGRSRWFRPRVGAWLNFSPDHLDVHASLEAYAEAKSALWLHMLEDDVAVVNNADPVVRSWQPVSPKVVTFGTPASDVSVDDGGKVLRVGGEPLLEIRQLPRRFPHDLRNAEAAVACALAAGAPTADLCGALAAFRGLPHRLQLVAESDGICWYNDSKATTPDAVLAATSAFESAVLIAGGRNKGLDLGCLANAASVRAVVAIGEAAEEISAIFAGSRPVRCASDMETAVAAAGEMALAGDAILLSPGCTSFDWYGSYRQRGEHFATLVRNAVGQEEPQ